MKDLIELVQGKIISNLKSVYFLNYGHLKSQNISSALIDMFILRNLRYPVGILPLTRSSGTFYAPF